MKKNTIYITAVAFAMLISCKGEPEAEKESNKMATASFKVEKNPVDTMIIRRGVFQKQLNANGKLRSIKSCDLSFNTSGVISSINYRNGQRVSAGSVIATLATDELDSKAKQLEHTIDKAELDLLDYLIGQGYNTDSIDVISKEVMRVANLRSGLATALSEKEKLASDYKKSKIIAPFSGKVANITLKKGEANRDILCSVIDDSSFDVEFSLLETEMDMVAVGGRVVVVPFNNKEAKFIGEIIEVNPIVNDKGQIMIKGKVKGSNVTMDGMSVRVYVEKSSPNHLIVPKSAVVIRDNMEVLFRYKDGKAMWTYVNILMANNNQYVVTANTERNAELNEGDAIITSGNLNLGDASDVEVKN